MKYKLNTISQVNGELNFVNSMRIINDNPTSYDTYYKMGRSNKEWQKRFDDFLKGKKTLPLLYDPFFKNLFNPDIHKGRLSELISAMLGQEVTVIDILPSESSAFMGALIIMDILVKMSDGSYANIEIQKVSYFFPAERMSCYSSDLVMRQYDMLRNRSLEQHDNSATYQKLNKVHTIIFFEKSDKNLISRLDKQLYFHVGKTRFNTEIDMELLQDYTLISLDTFRKYRYSDIIKGNTQITGYDYDSSAYKEELSEAMKQKRLMYLSLFVTDEVDDMERLLELYPELSGIVSDMNSYMTRPGEALDMYSEALRILDKNSMDMLIDEMREELNAEKAKAEETAVKLDAAEARADAAEAEIARLRAELAKKSN